MITRAVLALLLVTATAAAAEPRKGKTLWEVLYPHDAKPPPAAEAPAPAQPAPVASPPPPVVVVMPPAAAAPTAARKAPKRVKTKGVAKPKAAKPKPGAVDPLPSWCGRVPAASSLEQVEAAAPLFLGRRLSGGERKQAVACLASKKGA